MKPLTLKIPKELFTPQESKDFEGVYDIGSIKLKADSYVFSEPLVWKVQITNTGGALLVRGCAKGNACTECARCLEPANISINADIEGYLKIASNDEAADTADEQDFEILRDDKRIDMADLIYSAVLLELPLIPLCSDSCKGICPNCGVNLNMDECRCAVNNATGKQSSNPFSVLADLNFD